MSNPYTGGVLLSFKVSDELAQMIEIARTHEHHNRSEFIRKAIMLYLEQGGYFKSPALDIDEKMVKELVEQAKREIE